MGHGCSQQRNVQCQLCISCSSYQRLGTCIYAELAQASLLTDIHSSLILLSNTGCIPLHAWVSLAMCCLSYVCCVRVRSVFEGRQAVVCVAAGQYRTHIVYRTLAVRWQYGGRITAALSRIRTNQQLMSLMMDQQVRVRQQGQVAAS